MTLIVDEMSQDERLQVVAVFSPEHGFRGDKQAETGDPLFYIDKPTGLPVFSAYNMTAEQMSKVLQDMNIEAVLIDMQDVGVRLYTFVWTMYALMEGASLLHHSTSSAGPKPIVVITDRPNPLGGELVDGPLVNMSCCASGYGRLPIPFLHGMTIGELGLLFNSVFKIPSDDVIVVKMLHWERHMTWTSFQEANSVFPPWIPPSPNLPTVMSAHAYGATVFLEATTVAEGRGTTTPFTLFGAPFLDAEDLSARLNKDFRCAQSSSSVSHAASAQRKQVRSTVTAPSSSSSSSSSKKSAAGSCYRAAYFQPTWSKYNHTVVPGVQWFPWRSVQAATLLPSNLASPNNTASTSPFVQGVQILCATRDLSVPADAFQWDGSWFGHDGTELIDFYAGTPTLRNMIDSGLQSEDIVKVYEKDVALFRHQRQQYLLY
uniref:DUF1343 domain-containing protein n=1 Tax=Spumella elongata TaxID=89044 RepID=A0A7S3MBG6_9STRA|eukprot:CAMPEP_0184989764 /NCGR_PEP_ID=MMETSP1098-20130426/29978_1 /TAXON_ID=89044 /ORGANISM="Spumella elongata, Strain CCAP 955/1" /LENGTH=430 /DNA_ID=CAMNT_0027514829 /DNA_START=205 /DNA_END=1497 /DNA_ORIENTATION=-